MTADKMIKVAVNIALAATVALLILWCSPLAAATPARAPYLALLIVFWLLLLLSALTGELQRGSGLSYISYIGADNEVKKRLVKPGSAELRAAAGRLLKPGYLALALILALLCALNHLLLFYPALAASYSAQLFGPAGTGVYNRNIWLCAGSLSVLLLAGAVIVQTQQLRRHDRLFNIQNLIIHTHSRLALGKLHLRFADSEKMFLKASKLEYVLQATTAPGLALPHGQALLQCSLTLKLTNDFPVTEYCFRQLSLFVGETLLECRDAKGKYYPIFAENQEFTLNFYLRCQNISALDLSQIFAENGFIRLYYSCLVKNSFSVITALSGSTLYIKEPQTALSGHSYLPQESKDNCYYYM